MAAGKLDGSFAGGGEGVEADVAVGVAYSAGVWESTDGADEVVDDTGCTGYCTGADIGLDEDGTGHDRGVGVVRCGI